MGCLRLTYEENESPLRVSRDEETVTPNWQVWTREKGENFGVSVVDQTNGGSGSGMGWLDWVQGGLDIVGLVPVVGEIADGANALIYTARGDYLNAGLSAAAMIPFAGWGATGGKLINKAIRYSDEVAAVAANANRVSHIMQSHHAWNKVFANPTWDKVSPLIQATMEYGTSVPYKGVNSKMMYYNGFQIQVTYKNLPSGKTAISDAWVLTR